MSRNRIIDIRIITNEYPTSTYTIYMYRYKDHKAVFRLNKQTNFMI